MLGHHHISDELFFAYLHYGKIPPHPPSTCCDPEVLSIERIQLRERAIAMGMYALVSFDWVAKLHEWVDGRRVLEVMSGRGWLAKALQELGTDIVASDNDSWFEKAPPLVRRVKADAKQMARASTADILLMSWPPYDEPIAAKTAAAWGSTRPIVFIGEDADGCTADERFFKGFEVIQRHPIPRWPHIQDQLHIGYWRGV